MSTPSFSLMRVQNVDACGEPPSILEFGWGSKFANHMAESVKKGIEEAGGSATVYQGSSRRCTPPPSPPSPIITPDELAKYDAFIIGVPTRFGNYPAQLKAFWDSTSGLWASGVLAGNTLAHHGVVFVPLGCMGAFAASDGSRQPSALELEIASIQGKAFYGVVSKVKF
ncbi:flavoprotein-like protein [Mycena epipterygia]|nr:flavoprotein-like protein [Mycena epipterygia]